MILNTLITPYVALCVLLTLLGVARAAEDCIAFSIDGPNDATVQFYRFYDFRNAPTTDRMPLGDPAASDREEAGSLEISKVTTDSSWMDDWKITSRYPNAANEKSLARHYVPNHVFIDKHADEAQLALYTDRLRNDTQQAREVYFSEALVDSVSLRLKARITGAPGAVAGFFIYFNDTQKSDIEVLTRDEDNRIHYSNQPTENSTTGTTIPGTTHNETRSGSYQDWTVYRLDWLRLQGLSAWYIDGKLGKTSRVNVPVTPSTVYINMWSSGASYSGRMDYGTNATLEIQWIQMAFNASSVAVKNLQRDETVCTVEDGTAYPSSAGTRFATVFGVQTRWLVVAVILLIF